MDDLITKYFNRKITPTEKKELFSLMETDENLKNDFIALQNLYGLYSFLPSSEKDEVTALRKLKQFRQMRRRRNILLRIKQVGGYAAAVCITALATVVLMKYVPFAKEPPQPAAAYEELTTPAGQRVTAKLHDGTIVWLNARSTLRYPAFFAGKERRVELNGEAYFEVAHNEKQPFVVSTERLDIKALGTRFNVSAYQRSAFNTSLIDGSVKIYNRGNEANAMFLKPSEYAELEDNRLIRRTFDNLDFLLWKDGIYAFDNVPFTDIMDQMQWFYDVKIEVHNRKLNAYKFSGKIRHRDGLESVLRTLQKVYYFSFVKDDESNTVTIR
jgi:ferric-dicitrate binding protein FerR (iron transport regulator)